MYWRFFFWCFSSASHPLPCFVFVTQTFKAENEGYNGPENDDEKAEPQSDEPLQADMKSNVSEKEDKDEENVQFLPGIGFYSWNSWDKNVIVFLSI